MAESPKGRGDNSNTEPFGAYHFTVTIDHEEIAYPFRSVSGLKSESTVVELEEGGFNLTTRKLIGRTKYPNLVLKRGFCGANSVLYKMRLAFQNDLPSKNAAKKGWKTPYRISGVVTQKGPDGACAKWRFTNGWVCKWEGPDLDASKNEISIETIEIAHEGISMLAETSEKAGK